MSVVDRTIYHSPIETRYATQEMLALFSEQHKVEIWRTIWTELAKAQKELGCPITDQQVAELRKNQSNIDFGMASRIEAEIRHDVMAHIKTYAHCCPSAGPIIHLGATSNDITDNADVIIQRQALDLILPAIARCCHRLGQFIELNRSAVAVAYTHYQPAQATTYAKRAAGWAADLLVDLTCLQNIRSSLRLKGFKGATGSQDSYLELLGNCAKVKELEDRLVDVFDFESVFVVTGQTYSRKQDVTLVSALASLGASIHKICTDIRLLAHDNELAEPFRNDQIGSSAMPYKRNPILCERCCSLSRHLMTLAHNPLMTLSTQWLERSLDDSANRRITLSEAFLVAGGLLNTLQHILEGIQVNHQTVRNNLMRHLPFMATEKVLMDAVKRGGDRQECHAKLRECAFRATRDGKDLFAIIAQEFPFVEEGHYNDPLEYIGCIPQQVDRFIDTELNPALCPYRALLEVKAQLEL